MFVDTMKKKISFENAMDLLLYADSKNCALLKEAVLSFLLHDKEQTLQRISFDGCPSHLIKDFVANMILKTNKKHSFTVIQEKLCGMSVNVLRGILQEEGLDYDGSRECLIKRIEDNDLE